MPVHFEKLPLRAAVLFSGAGSTLANLIEQVADGRLNGIEICTTISSRTGVPGIKIAKSAGLPVTIICKGDFPDSTGFSRAVTDAVAAAECDLVIMAGYLCLWDFPPRYVGRVLNVHPALLPGFGGRGMYGLHVHQAVLAAGERESGATVHIVDHEYDHGPIVAQARVPVRPGDTPESLAARVGVAERELYPQVLQRVVDTRGGVLNDALKAAAAGLASPGI